MACGLEGGSQGVTCTRRACYAVGMLIAALFVVPILVALLGPYVLGRVGGKLVLLETARGFVRWYPNPGIKLGGFHLCANRQCKRWSKGDK